MAARLAALAEEISSIDRAEKEKSQERISLNEQKNALQRKTDGKQARLNALSVLEKTWKGTIEESGKQYLPGKTERSRIAGYWAP